MQIYEHFPGIIEETSLWVVGVLCVVLAFIFFPLADLLFLHIENQSYLMHWETLSLKTYCLSLRVILSAKSCEIIIDFKSQQQKYLICR